MVRLKVGLMNARAAIYFGGDAKEAIQALKKFTYLTLKEETQSGAIFTSDFGSVAISFHLMDYRSKAEFNFKPSKSKELNQKINEVAETLKACGFDSTIEPK